MALPVTDTWTSGTTQGIASYGAYQVLDGGFNVRNGAPGLELTNGGGTYNLARITSETFNADQYSQTVVTASQISNSSYCGPAVRCQSGANTGYHVETNGSQFYLSKALAGAQTTIAGPVSVSFASGDIIRLEVTGTGATVTLKVFKALAASPTSFSQVGTDYTDSSSPITTAGTAGVFGYGYTEASYQPVGTWTAGNLSAGGPAITGTDTSTPAPGSSLTITGTAFGASQGSGYVTLGGIVQPVTAWGDTSITVTVTRGTAKYGSQNIVVRDNALTASSPFAVTLTPPAGWSYIDLTSVNSSPALRLRTIPDLATGDQIAYQSVGGVTFAADAQFFWSPGKARAFDVEVWTSADGWGGIFTQYLEDPPSVLQLWAALGIERRLRSARRSSSYALGVGQTNPLQPEKWFAEELAPSAGAASAAGVTLTATASLIAGSATGAINGTAAGQTLTATSSLIAGSASGAVNGTASGVTLIAASSLVAGTATGATNGTAAGATLVAASSLIAGAATGDASAPGATLTATASLIAGSASAGVNGTASGATLTASASMVPGSAAGQINGTAAGATPTATSSLVAGSAAGEISATAAGVTLTAVASLLSGSASAGGSGTAPGALVSAAASILAGAASGTISSTAAGATITAIAALVPGSASGASGATAAGVTLTAVAGLIAGAASASNTAPGATLTAAASLLAGSASGVANGTAPGVVLTATASLVVTPVTLSDFYRYDVPGQAGALAYTVPGLPGAYRYDVPGASAALALAA